MITSPIDISIPLSLEEGEHTIYFYAIDPVGNSANSKPVSKPVRFFLKKIVPQLVIGQPSYTQGDDTNNNNNKRLFISSATPITVSVEAATPSTEYLVQYAIDDTANSNNIITSATNSITFSLPREMRDGLHTIWYRAIRLPDKRVTIWYKQEVYLDNTPPAVSINIQDGAILTDSDTITITATDEGSGVAKIFYRIDGGKWQEVDVAASSSSGK